MLVSVMCQAILPRQVQKEYLHFNTLQPFPLGISYYRFEKE
jgi:hypothetical protein